MRKHIFSNAIIEKTLGELTKENIELQSFYDNQDNEGAFVPEVWRELTPEEIIEQQQKIIKEAEKRIRFELLKKCQKALQELDKNKNNKSGLESAFNEHSRELEAIIYYKLRPAPTVCRTNDGTFILGEELDELGHADEDATQKWKDILEPLTQPNSVTISDTETREEESKADLFWMASRAGRIETGTSSLPDWLGSTFLFSKNGHTMTNRHVLINHDFCWHDQNGDVTWNQSVPHEINFDALYLDASSAKNTKVTFKKVPFLAKPNEYDCGVIQLYNKFLPRDLQEPLPIFQGELSKDELRGRLICVIGHPGFDPYAAGTELSHVFRGIYSKKRIMPGRLMQDPLGRDEQRNKIVMFHDCSTLGGASGSCIIDLQKGKSFGKVIGLHYGGVHGKQNYAIPIWELRDIWEQYL